jgi:L-amino acid N-acyltransferase YncA
MTDKANLQFRLAKLTDIKTLVEINIDDDEDYRTINQKMFRELVKSKLVLVALENKEIVGLLYWRPDFLGRFNQWYLKQVTVRKDARGKGVGVQLLNYFLNFAKKKKVEKVFGDIHNDNYPSLNMALNAGALISGTIEGVGNTEEKDERVMVRFELQS